MVLLVAAVLFGMALGSTVRQSVDRALMESSRAIAETQIANLGHAIDNYRLSHRELPSSLEDLTQPSEKDPEPFLLSIPRDPWGNTYRYRRVRTDGYAVTSPGPDGKPGTLDDVLHVAKPRR